MKINITFISTLVLIACIGSTVLAFYFPWVSFGVIMLTIIFIILLYYYTLKKTQNKIEFHKEEIELYFEHKIGFGNYHYNYIKDNLLFFTQRDLTKFLSNTLQKFIYYLIIITIIYLFRFTEDKLIFSILAITLGGYAVNFSFKIEKPITDFLVRSKQTFSEKELQGEKEYPLFFDSDGEYERIRMKK